MNPSSGSYFVFALTQMVALFFSIGVAGMGFGGLFGAQTKQQEVWGERLLLLGGALSVLAALLFLMSLITAVALRARASWAIPLGTATAWLALLEVPLGTAFGIYWLRQAKRK